MPARLRPADVIATPTTPIESAKREAARKAVDEYVKTGMAIGVGSGSTIVYAIQRLAELVEGGLDVRCVPTSFQSRQVSRACAIVRECCSQTAMHTPAHP
jgi:ribose 5-phosphate isomerase